MGAPMTQFELAFRRGSLARATTLRMERLTTDCALLIERMSAPLEGTFGRVEETPEPFSLDEQLRARSRVESAYVDMRRDRPEALAAARVALFDLLERYGPDAPTPTLEGPARTANLSYLAVALSQAGCEEKANDVSRWLLHEARTHDRRSLIIIELNNLSVRLMKLGTIDAFGGDRTTALTYLEEARTLAAEALDRRLQSADKRDESRSVGLLLSRANLARIDLEIASLVAGDAERADALAAVCADAASVVRDSYDHPTVRPVPLLTRAATLGMVYLELARLAEGCDPDAMRQLAWQARVGIRRKVDVYQTDADESVGHAIRYGDACRMTGGPEGRDEARRVWMRSRDRALVFRDAESGLVRALDQRLTSVEA